MILEKQKKKYKNYYINIREEGERLQLKYTAGGGDSVADNAKK